MTAKDVDHAATRYATDQAAELTYPETGETRALALGLDHRAEKPRGYHYLYRRVRLGTGDEAFKAARAVVFGWGMQRGIGADVYPPDTPPTEGLTVLVTTHFGPVPITAPCRVVWTVDDDKHAGFGYGTLPGHPERGEEAFVVSRDQAGDVWCTILAFARPAAWYTRLAGPAGRVVQGWIAGRYLHAFR